MSTSIFFGTALIFLLISVVLGFFRGLSKARIRGICVIVSAVLSVVITLLLRSFLVSEDFVKNIILPHLQNMLENSETVVELLGLSETLNEVLLHTATSLISPALCLAIFIVLSFVTWVFFLIGTLFFGSYDRYYENGVTRFPRAMLWGLVQGVVILFIFMLPISAYLEIAPAVTDEVVESGIVTEEQGEELHALLENEIDPLNHSTLITMFRWAGGQELIEQMTDFRVNRENIDFSAEVDSVSSFGFSIFRLTQKQFAEYGPDEADVFIAIADSFEDSKLLPTIAGEFIYGATDAWLQKLPFLGAEKPSFGENSEIFDPFFETLLTVLHQDAHDVKALRADMNTVAQLISILARQGVFENLTDTENLMTVLSSDGIVNSLVTVLGKNESMKVLIPEITNMGMRAIATTLGIPEDTAAVYGDFLNDVTVALNDIRNLPEAEQIDTLTSELVTAFDEAGIAVDREIVDCYSASMIKDLVGSVEEGVDLTAADVQDFFTLYAITVAESEEEQGGPTEEVAVRGTRPLSEASEIFIGSIYKNKSEEELKKTGAAVLAQASKALTQITQDENVTITEQAQQILTEAFAELLADNTELLEKVQSIELTAVLSVESVTVTAALQSAETVVTSKVTLDDLLLDTQAAAETITAETLEKEANAISSIFNAANDLMGSMSDSSDGSESPEQQLAEVAGTVGNILDSLNETASFGSEKTAGLFTAVMQSETVRETANIDMSTATQMADKATQGENVNYTQTFTSVSTGVNIFTKLGQDGEEVTEEDMIELIRNINPQVAGMIQIYVTPARIEGYGVNAKYSGTSAELISEIFAYMADNDMPEAEYQAEAKALNQVLNIAISAKSHSSEKNLFTHGDQVGILPTATETVNTFMNSKAVSHALRTTMLDENGNVIAEKEDAFDLGEKIPETSPEYAECIEAIEAYYAEHQDEETKLTLKAVAALLGVHAGVNLD